MSTHSIVRVLEAATGKADLVEFLAMLKAGGTTFRYFQNRSVDVIESHLVTLLLKIDSDIVAYGHLEEEDNRLWLGIAVSDDWVGKGWGKAMMEELVAEGQKSSFDKISLRVDIGNESGIRLYEKIGFQTIEDQDERESILMEKQIVGNDEQER